MLIDDEVLVDIADKIAARDFYEPAHQAIFAAMVKLYQKHSPVDLLTLGNELRATGKLDEVGGAELPGRLDQLRPQRPPTPLNTPTSCERLPFAAI